MPMSANRLSNHCFITGINFAGTAVLLRTVVDYQCIPVIFSSSCATCGVPERVPIAEDHPQHPINPAGSSKLFVERMLSPLREAVAVTAVAEQARLAKDGRHPTRLIVLRSSAISLQWFCRTANQKAG